MSKVLGILGNKLIIDAFYGGGNTYEIDLGYDGTKGDMIEDGVHVFESRDHLEAMLRDITIEEYHELIRTSNERNAKEREERKNKVDYNDPENDLPF